MSYAHENCVNNNWSSSCAGSSHSRTTWWSKCSCIVICWHLVSNYNKWWLINFRQKPLLLEACVMSHMPTSSQILQLTIDLVWLGNLTTWIPTLMRHSSFSRAICLGDFLSSLRSLFEVTISTVQRQHRGYLHWYITITEENQTSLFGQTCIKERRGWKPWISYYVRHH